MNIAMMLKHEKPSSPDCCCENMREAIEDNEHPLYYSGAFDEFGLKLSSQYEYSILNCCPWCSTNLPESRRNAWYKSLESQGVDPWENEIPINYLSSAWWSNA